MDAVLGGKSDHSRHLRNNGEILLKITVFDIIYVLNNTQKDVFKLAIVIFSNWPLSEVTVLHTQKNMFKPIVIFINGPLSEV